MLRETETIEFKKSTAELKEAVISIAAMLNKHSRAEVYVNEHMKWRADLSESRRKEIPEIPDRAISEAIGNSLCHRDYGNPMSALPQVSRLSLIGSRQVS